MTTRSGTRYKPTMEREQGEEGASEPAATVTSDRDAAPLADLVRLLLEDHRRRVEELADKRRRREADGT